MSLALSGLLSVLTRNSEGIKLIHPSIYPDEPLHMAGTLLHKRRFLPATMVRTARS